MHMFTRNLIAAAASVGISLAAASAQAKVQVTVDLDAQTIHIEAKNQTFDWQVSSGATGYETPTGKYRVLWMDKNHHSDEYDGVPMPSAIFFAPGFAIHGTSKSPWGHPASHGCVRLPVAKAAILFGLVKKEGADITITGTQTKQAVAPPPPRNALADFFAGTDSTGASGGAQVTPVRSTDVRRGNSLR